MTDYYEMIKSCKQCKGPMLKGDNKYCSRCREKGIESELSEGVEKEAPCFGKDSAWRSPESGVRHQFNSEGRCDICGGN